MTKTVREIKESRPLSPHLTIYKPQISSVLSIFHRASGAGLFFALSFLMWWFAAWSFAEFDPKYLIVFDFTLVKIAAFLTSAGFFYHLCNGIRHLMWDIGKGYAIREVHFSGWLVVTTSILSTAAFWLCILMQQN